MQRPATCTGRRDPFLTAFNHLILTYTDITNLYISSDFDITL